MSNLLEYILDLFRDEGHARAFIANPDQALADAGLSTVSSAQLQSVAVTAIPSLAMAGSGDPVTDLQQARSRATAAPPCRTATPPACMEIRPSPTSMARATPVPSTTVPRSPTHRRSTTPSTIRRCTRRRSSTPSCTVIPCTTTQFTTLRCKTTQSTKQHTPIRAWTFISASDVAVRTWPS